MTVDLTYAELLEIRNALTFQRDEFIALGLHPSFLALDSALAKITTAIEEELAQ